jgi:surfactin synthase thioesterase subunit
LREDAALYGQYVYEEDAPLRIPIRVYGWFPGAEAAAAPRLFWFPHAGGGASAAARFRVARYSVCPARLPGRESRLKEQAFESMAQLVDALAAAIEPYTPQPFAFFGHSMGAVVAFELVRLLRKRGRPLPGRLIASAARAPQFRRNHVGAQDENITHAHLDALSEQTAESFAVRVFAGGHFYLCAAREEFSAALVEDLP